MTLEEKSSLKIQPCVPQSLEAKMLFDADKLDVTGAIGIARMNY